MVLQAQPVTRLGTWLLAHDRMVVGLVLAVTFGFAVVAARVRIDFRYEDLLPQSHPFMAVHNRFHKNFSEANVLTVMIEAREGTIFTPEILGTVGRGSDS